MPMNDKNPKKREPQDFPVLVNIPDRQAIANLADFYLERSYVASQEKLSYAGSSMSDISSNFNFSDSEAPNMASQGMGPGEGCVRKYQLNLALELIL
jgi:hypothetical protein